MADRHLPVLSLEVAAMSCVVLQSLSDAVAAVPGLTLPAGLGADALLAEQSGVLASAVAVLQRELALRMAARERHGPPCTDVRGDAVAAGLSPSQAGRLRHLGTFAAAHPRLEAQWLAGTVRDDQVLAVRDVAVRLATPELRVRLVDLLLPHLPGLDGRGTRRLAVFTADQLQPGDPDSGEQADYAHRSLVWSRTPRGGIAFQGYLPAAEAAAFTGAIEALVADLRAAGDGVAFAQRRADALAALVDRAGLPTGGGLPAALTLTVSLDEASRIALRDPAMFGTRYQARPMGGATVGGSHAGDATVRFGLCAGAITPVLHDTATPAGLLGKIATTPVVPLAVGRAVRLATAAQRTALRLRDGGCVIPDCAVAAAHTQPHHVVGWAIDGPTDLDNLVSVCFVHHRQVELGRYTFLPKHHPRPAHAAEHPNWWIIPPLPGRDD